MSQIALPLGWSARPRDDAFIVTPSNARAAHLLDHWGSWPTMTALLTGPRKSGRSLLARIFAAKSGGAVIDNAECAPEEHLFHAWNRAQAARRPLLLVADAPPPAWSVALPDLRSRLGASIVAPIGPPDDALVRALLTDLFQRRGLDARLDLIDWLCARLERSHIAVIRAVDALDQEVLETRKRLSVPLARTTLAAAGLIPPAVRSEVA
jgi:chromosomal replication initiation ATPase DnaA